MGGTLGRLSLGATAPLAVAAVLAGTAQGKLEPACGAIRGETLAKNGLGRVVKRDGRYGYNVDGCLHRAQTIVRLFPTRRDDGGLCGTIGPVRMRGEKAALVYDSCGGAGSVYYVTVKVVDLRSGKVLHRRFSPQDVGSSVASLVLKRNGSAAWIRVDCPDPPRCSSVVLKADRTRRHRLDAGAGIARDSLSLHGSTLTWITDGVRRSATLT